MKQRHNFNGETTSWFQRWNNVMISRWDNVTISTLIQFAKSTHNSMLIQRLQNDLNSPMLKVRRWNNVTISRWNNVMISRWDDVMISRWDNVTISTLIQFAKSKHNPTLIQPWYLTLIHRWINVEMPARNKIIGLIILQTSSNKN